MAKIRWIIMLFFLMLQTVQGNNNDILPFPLPGWTASKIEISGDVFPELYRIAIRYYHNSQGQSIRIMIDTTDCKRASLIKKVAGNSKALESLSAGSRSLRFKGYLGLEKYDNEGGLNASILVKDCLIVTVGGNNPPPGAIKAYLDRLDFKKIAGFESELHKDFMDIIDNLPNLDRLY